METLQRTANRGSISTGYDIDNSCKFEADNTEIIYRTNDSGTNRKTFTTSLWFKRTELEATQEVWHGGRNGEMVGIGILTYSGFADQLWVDVGGGTGNTGTLYRSASNQVIRDTSAWYHVVLAVDTTQSTAADRMKVWLNGVEVTSWEQHQIPVQDYQGALESGTEMAWGGYRPSNADLFSGYLAECHYLDGVAKVQTDFGEFDEDSGIWIPKKYTGTYGDNGCYMKFNDSSSMGADSSGNSNTFTLNNITAADQSTDTPTNNFCTWNPLWTFSKPRTISEGGTNADGSSSWGGVKGTIGVTNGKWYWENKASGTDTIIGWQTDNCVAESNEESMHNVKDTIGFYTGYDYVYIRDETSGRNDTSTTGSNVSGQIIGMALDLDSSPQTATFYRNGSAVSSAINIDGLTGKTLFPFMSQYNYNAESNFGGYTSFSISSAASDANGYGTFEYAPPSGYYAICGKNLAEFGGSA